MDIWMHRCRLFCHNQGIYFVEYIHVTKLNFFLTEVPVIRVSHSGGEGGTPPPHPTIFFSKIPLIITIFVRKVKQFIRKYYITWLMAQFVVIDIAPLTVLFCNHQLFAYSLICNWPPLKKNNFNPKCLLVWCV